MRCPKCDTTNSDFAVSCLKCGHKFIEEQNYEDFRPDYRVAPPTPEQLAAQQAKALSPIYEQSKKLKSKGIKLLSIGVILIVVGVIVGFVLPMFIGGSEGEKLDNWSKDAEDGESTDLSVTVKSKSKEESPIGTLFNYTFEDSDTYAYFNQDLGSGGDTWKITFTKSDDYILVKQAEKIKQTLWILLFIIFLIIGLIITLLGVKRLSKSKKVLSGIHQPPAAPPPAQAPPPGAAPPPGQPPQPGYGQPPAGRPPAQAPPPAAAPPPAQPPQPSYGQRPAQAPPPAAAPPPAQPPQPGYGQPPAQRPPAQAPPPGAAPPPGQPHAGRPPAQAPPPGAVPPPGRPPQPGYGQPPTGRPPAQAPPPGAAPPPGQRPAGTPPQPGQVPRRQ